MATAITTSPLPALDSLQIQGLKLNESPDHYNAYKMILQAEWCAVRQSQAKEHIVSARVVGYLLLEFHAQSDTFGDSPCASLVRWVTLPHQSDNRNAHNVIFDVGRLYRDKFIRLFRTSYTSYPPPSLHPSRPSFDTLGDMIKDSMEPTGKDYRTDQKRALARDGYRCMVTGMIDETSLKRCADLQTLQKRSGISAVTVQTAHILNESTTQGTDPAGTSKNSAEVNKTHYAAGAMAILERFGLSNFTKDFKRRGGVHETWNLLSLEPNLHRKFDTLNLWFESTPQPGRYKVCVSDEYTEGYIHRNADPKPHIDGAPMVVEFTSQLEEAPPPCSVLLALHATCARVARVSGAAEFFDQLWRDAEETKVLAFDGSSAPLLSNLLSAFAVVDVMS